MRKSHLILVLALLILGWVFVPADSYFRSLFAQIAVSALLAIAFDVCLGFGGMLTMATALLFGFGAYCFYYALQLPAFGLLTGILLAEAAVILLAIIIGVLAVRLSGPGFFVFTLLIVAVSQTIAQNWREVTGGDDGVAVDATLFSLLGYPLTADNRYAVALLLLGIGYFSTAALMRSPFGTLLQGVRDNEFRVELLGFNARAIKLLAFAWAAFVAGLAGIGYVLAIEHIHSGLFAWTISGQAMLWAFLGGVGTLIGPVIGAALVVPLEDYVGSLVPYPRIATGLLLVVVVLTMRRAGLLGIWTNVAQKFSNRATTVAPVNYSGTRSDN
jgi:branched-chain amino acid transport system permease protein